jgi:NDP-sugar pyrophosphorylase family protein
MKPARRNTRCFICFMAERGEAVDSVVSGGSILSGGCVRNCVLSRGVRVHRGAFVEDSVLMDNVDIGRHAKVRRAILDKNVRVAPGETIGYDLKLGPKAWLHGDIQRDCGGGRHSFASGDITIAVLNSSRSIHAPLHLAERWLPTDSEDRGRKGVSPRMRVLGYRRR